MQPREQTLPPTLARKLGPMTHVSPLLRRVCALSGCTKNRLGERLLKCAVERGARHYEREFPAALPADRAELSVAELPVVLCLGHHQYRPVSFRAAAQLLTSSNTAADKVTRLAELERCETVLL